MIKQIYDTAVTLSDSYYGKKVRSYLDAYGAKYDFCRLFESDSGGHILAYNSSAVADGDFDSDELSGFIKMLFPDTVEVSSKLTLQISDEYSAVPRTLFKAVPAENNIIPEDVKRNTLLDEIYPILKEGFGISEYDMWYTDISHRIRHGVSDIFLYRSTTVTKQFDIDGFVFISHIATAAEARGKGTAGNFLRWLCGEYEKQGKSVYLYAKDERYSFYKGLGFEEIYRDNIYEKIK